MSAIAASFLAIVIYIKPTHIAWYERRASVRIIELLLLFNFRVYLPDCEETLPLAQNILSEMLGTLQSVSVLGKASMAPGLP